MMKFQGDFREENFSTAMAILKDSGDAAKGDQRGRKGGIKGLTYFYHLLKLAYKHVLCR
jgi:hypothetical protein